MTVCFPTAVHYSNSLLKGYFNFKDILQTVFIYLNFFLICKLFHVGGNLVIHNILEYSSLKKHIFFPVSSLPLCESLLINNPGSISHRLPVSNICQNKRTSQLLTKRDFDQMFQHRSLTSCLFWHVVVDLTCYHFKMVVTHDTLHSFSFVSRCV